MKHLSLGSSLTKPTALLHSSVILGTEHGGGGIQAGCPVWSPDILPYVWGWENGCQDSAFHVNTKTQVQPPEPTFKKLSVVTPACNISVGEVETGRSWGLLDS